MPVRSLAQPAENKLGDENRAKSESYAINIELIVMKVVLLVYKCHDLAEYLLKFQINDFIQEKVYSEVIFNLFDK